MATDAPQSPDVDAAAARKAANRFDIRRIIGGLFLLYGVILALVGLLGSEATKTKAAGINVNLWTGLGMLVFGALMVTWALTRPVEPPAAR
jgi:ABC-type transport system involved in multi-copper enzyme maturation permease subunit